MSETVYTITSVNEGHVNDWSNPKGGMVRYFNFDFNASDGTSGYGSFGRKWSDQNTPPDFPRQGYQFIADKVEYNDEHGSYKFKGVKRPEDATGASPSAAPSQSRSAQGGGQPETNVKERMIVRQHAQKVVAERIDPAHDQEAYFKLCDVLCKDVFEYASGAVEPDTPLPPENGKGDEETLMSAREFLAAHAKECGINDLSFVRAALLELTGKDTLDLGSVTRIEQIVQRAKQLEEASQDDIPF